MSEDQQRQSLLARMKGGVDIKKERRKVTAIAAAGALLLGALVAAYRYRGRVKQVFQTSLSADGLRSQGYSNDMIDRILATTSLVDSYAGERNLDPDFVNGVIWVESRFKPTAKSGAGARGLMQVMPGTQTYYEGLLGIPAGDPFDPEHSIKLGTYGLQRYLDKWEGDERKSLGSYNWGIGNVQKHPNAFPPQVESYVTSVQAARSKFQRAREAS